MDYDLEVSRRHGDLFSMKYLSATSIMPEEKRQKLTFTKKHKKNMMRRAIRSAINQKNSTSPSNTQRNSSGVEQVPRQPLMLADLASPRFSSTERLFKVASSNRIVEGQKPIRFRVLSTARQTHTARDSMVHTLRENLGLSSDRNLHHPSMSMRTANAIYASAQGVEGAGREGSLQLTSRAKGRLHRQIQSRLRGGARPGRQPRDQKKENKRNQTDGLHQVPQQETADARSARRKAD